MRYRILTLNQISSRGLARLPVDHFDVSSHHAEPHALMVRSADLHQMKIPESVLAVGRCGAGVNNIPVASLSQRGVPVFNAPGANANAVKELVLAGLLIAARNVCQAWAFTRSLTGDDRSLEAAVEEGKKLFIGFELPGRTLGVIGLGAVGVEVANAALALGMKVLGYDPQISVRRAWQLSASVEQALSLEDLFARSNAVTVHVPLDEHTRYLITDARLALMRQGGVILNFARAAIIDNDAIIRALDAGHLRAYVCDFPATRLNDHPKIVTLPHLGASTVEAEENCAVMVAETLKDFLENGNVRNCVNFPEAVLSRASNTTRLVIANRNVPNIVGQISTCLAAAGLNIAELLNKSLGENAYTIIDADGTISEELIIRVVKIDGVLAARVF